MYLRNLVSQLSLRITLKAFLVLVVLLTVIGGYTASQARADASHQTSPHTATAHAGTLRANSSLPSGCTNDGQVDYPGAIDCILTPPTTYDCNNALSPSNCNYASSDRPNSCPYWLWDYYFHLINQQGVPLDNMALPHTITLHP